MFGGIYFGQAYFGGSPEVPSTNGDCGGMFGTATFGSPYFGQHIQCVPIPPVPPKPPKPPKVPTTKQLGGIGHRKHKDWTPSELQDLENRRIATINDLIYEEIDEEDIALTVSLWLNIK